MTVVGDIAQSTGAWAHADWDEVLRLLPDRRPSRRAELTVGYRIPAPNMALAARVLAEAAPDLVPPRSVREDGRPPRFVRSPAPTSCSRRSPRRSLAERDEVGAGNVAVICPGSMVGRGVRGAGAGRHRRTAWRSSRASTTRSRSCRSAW